MHPRQWPEVSDFVALFCTLRVNARVKKHTDMLESHAFEAHAFRVRFSHVRVFFDSRNVQKSVTRIIYLGPLPSAPRQCALSQWGQIYNVAYWYFKLAAQGREGLANSCPKHRRRHCKFVREQFRTGWVQTRVNTGLA